MTMGLTRPPVGWTAVARWRPRTPVVGCLALWFSLAAFASGQGRGEEPRVTREALLMVVERGPGPVKGRPDAPVIVVEFSDFRCSYCRKFWSETLPRIEAEYIATGKVRFVYRHLVALGPPSARAAEAAECAGEQGRFWAYHDVLFERAASAFFTDGPLTEYAKELGFDLSAFDACLTSGRHRERILSESTIARSLGAAGTPTFLINGRLLIGAHPFETFKYVLDVMLAQGGAGPPGAPGPAGTPAR